MSASVQKVSGEMLNTSICLLYYIYFMKGTNKIQKNKKKSKNIQKENKILKLYCGKLFFYGEMQHYYKKC